MQIHVCNLFEFLEVLNLFKNVYSLFRENLLLSEHTHSTVEIGTSMF